MSGFLRTTGTVTGFTLVAAPLALIGNAAFAADSCQTTTPAATLVAPGICEVSFTDAGDYTFTAPSGIDKLQAVVVGAGAGSWTYNGVYGGGGGDVQFFDNVDHSAPVEITVGAGGLYDGGTGGDSEINGHAVPGGATGGESGNGHVRFEGDNGGGGGGAGGNAPSAGEFGPGVTASAIAAGSSLFPAVAGEPAFGAGGDSIVTLETTIDGTPNIPGNGGNGVWGHYDGVFVTFDGEDGIDGAVFLRWGLPLAATGVDGAGILAAGASLVAGGVVLTATRRRSQRA